jgi:pyrroloquinoline quinone (PQQ) biosynthesis protein C
MNNAEKIPTFSLRSYLNDLDRRYHQQLMSIPLFNATQTATWTTAQIQYFAAIFYHIRGHFINLAWHIANFSTNASIKQLILNNIAEEIGLNTRFSHEMLYARFATACGVDIHEEIMHRVNYLPFAKTFNQNHIQWLNHHPSEKHLALFSAYERLDNIDYPLLLTLGQSLGLSQHDLTFFSVHVHVDHFDLTLDNLKTTWQTAPDHVQEAFEFIYDNQYQMWCHLSDHVFSFKKH